MTAVTTENRWRLGLPWWMHGLFWLGYTLFWHTIFSPSMLSLEGWITSCIYTLVHAGVSYLNIYVLIPKLWQQHKLIYTLILLAAIVLGALLLGGLLYIWFNGLSAQGASDFFEEMQYVLGSLLGSTLTGVMLTMGTFLLLQRRNMEQKQERLEQEKMAAELQFLRNQLDPHFLFNALNNIYFLIKKDPDAAAKALAGFSDLLRYQIYEGQAERIPLRAEFDYLGRYAELAALRLPKSASIEVDFADVPATLLIPPLLLLPLVENAFKHVDKNDVKIVIQGEVRERQLRFEVKNSWVGGQAAAGEELRRVSGIGLENLRQRLGLIYAGRHCFNMEIADNWYQVRLSIDEL